MAPTQSIRLVSASTDPHNAAVCVAFDAHVAVVTCLGEENAELGVGVLERRVVAWPKNV